MVKETTMSRRNLVGAAGATLAAAPLGAASAQPRSQAGRRGEGPVIDNPVSKYPKPPFKRQSQPWPGLARDMDPRPTMARPAIAAPAASPGARR